MRARRRRGVGGLPDERRYFNRRGESGRGGDDAVRRGIDDGVSKRVEDDGGGGGTQVRARTRARRYDDAVRATGGARGARRDAVAQCGVVCHHGGCRPTTTRRRRRRDERRRPGRDALGDDGAHQTPSSSGGRDVASIDGRARVRVARRVARDAGASSRDGALARRRRGDADDAIPLRARRQARDRRRALVDVLRRALGGLVRFLRATRARVDESRDVRQVPRRRRRDAVLARRSRARRRGRRRRDRFTLDGARASGHSASARRRVRSRDSSCRHAVAIVTTRPAHQGVRGRRRGRLCQSVRVRGA